MSVNPAETPKPLFPTGKLIISVGAMTALRLSGQCAGAFLAKHQAGDFQFCEPADEQMNLRSLQGDGPIISRHYLESETVIAIYTAGDRSVTTIALEDEL